MGLGAGGHAKAVVEAFQLHWGECLHLVGLTDSDPKRGGQYLLGVPILGTDLVLPELARRGIGRFLMGLGGIGSNQARQRVFSAACALGLQPVGVQHPAAVAAVSAALGAGTVVLARAVIGPDAVVGANVIVNTGAIVEHDCRVGDHVHLATGCVLGGGVEVGSGAHVGLGACLLQGVCIGDRALVGAGAVVVRDVEPDAVVVGNPARRLR